MLGKTKKGQTAMEYLMTYGWAILIVLVVGGVLYYYGVFSPQTLVGESKTGFSGVTPYQWAVSNDTLTMALENRAGQDINVTSVEVDGTTLNSGSARTMSAGERMSTGFDSTGIGDYNTGDTYQLDVSIHYEYLETGIAKTSSGKLSGTV